MDMLMEWTGTRRTGRGGSRVGPDGGISECWRGGGRKKVVGGKNLLASWQSIRSNSTPEAGDASAGKCLRGREGFNIEDM
jgi:hypothetical protein